MNEELKSLSSVTISTSFIRNEIKKRKENSGLGTKCKLSYNYDWLKRMPVINAIVINKPPYVLDRHLIGNGIFKNIEVCTSSQDIGDHPISDASRSVIQSAALNHALKNQTILNLGGSWSQINSRFHMQNTIFNCDRGKCLINIETAGQRSKEHNPTSFPIFEAFPDEISSESGETGAKFYVEKHIINESLAKNFDLILT